MFQDRQNANKQAMAAASATERYLKMNASTLGVDPDAVQQMANESPIQYNQRLNSTIGNIMVGQKFKESQALQAQAAAATQAQQINNQQQQLALQQQQRQAAYIQQLLGQGQGQGQQQGQTVNPPPPSNIPFYLQPNQSQGSAQAVGQPAPVTPQTPPVPSAPVQQNAGLSQDGQNFIAKQYAAYVQGVHAAPQPDTINKWVSTYLGQEKPIGRTNLGPKLDDKANVIGTNWGQVTRRNDGTVMVKPSDMVLPVGQLPPNSPVLDGQGNPIQPGAVGAPIASPGIVSGTAAPTPIPMTPARQQAIKDAQDHLNLLTQNEAKINNLGQQVAAYIKANPNGAQTNAWMGTPFGLNIRRAIYGDVSGQNLDQGVANNLNAIMDNMREGSKTGSLGMRLTGSEWAQLKQAFPNPTQAPETQIQGWKNIASTNSYAKNYAMNYLKNIQTMQPGDAALAANAATPKPNFEAMQLPNPVAQTVRVISPDGRIGSIPANNLGKALQAGYRTVPSPTPTLGAPQQSGPPTP